MSDRRKLQLAEWIGLQLTIEPPDLAVVSGDASFRRYFRFNHQQQSIIAVDAPPQQENNQAYLQIGKLLKQFQIHVPDFLQVDLTQGFLLLSDLGDRLLLPELNPQTVDNYYHQAISTLLKIQQIPLANLAQLPHYSAEKLDFEMNLCNQWFIDRHLQLALSRAEKAVLASTYQLLIENALQQPRTMVHRDFHSRNLMICPAEQLGVLDFQDAVIGPISYDLVSLLKDCYIQWPLDKIKNWLQGYYQQAVSLNLLEGSFEHFFRQFEWMGLQRHIKVLGIFARLNYRDQKAAYLKDLPLTFAYVLDASSRYRELDDFHQLFKTKILPAMEAK